MWLRPWATAHQQSSQQRGNAPSIYSPQSLVNTSRAALDFVYTRLSYGLAISTNMYLPPHNMLVLSGGSSGGLYYNDWIEYAAADRPAVNGTTDQRLRRTG